MSDTLWVRRRSMAASGDAADDYDHSLFYRHADALDRLADSLGVRGLSDFFDTSDLEYNLSEEDLPASWIAEHEHWYPPSEALPALQRIIECLKAGEVKGIKEKVRGDLLDELEDCLVKLEMAEREGDLFHFCIVM